MKVINKQLLSYIIILNSFLYISTLFIGEQNETLELTARSKSNNKNKQLNPVNSILAIFNNKTPPTNIILNYNNFSNQSVMSVFALQNHIINCKTG